MLNITDHLCAVLESRLTDLNTLSKYCDTDTALKILHSQSLRWSAPHLFGDPFEPDYRLAPEIDFDTVHRSLVRHVVTNMFNNNHDGPPNNQLMATIQRWREREQFTDEEEAEPIMHNLLEPVVRNQWHKLSEYYRAWSDYAKKVRLVCFCSKPNNLPAWRRYADQHRGVVLEFHCGSDTALAQPEAVSYDETPPVLTTLREQVSTMLGKTRANDLQHFHQMHLHKSKYDSLDKEWRCIRQEEDNDIGDDPDTWYSYYKFAASELKAVYFGLQVDESRTRQISQLLKEKFPLAKRYRAKRSSGKYALEFVSCNADA